MALFGDRLQHQTITKAESSTVRARLVNLGNEPIWP